MLCTRATSLRRPRRGTSVKTKKTSPSEHHYIVGFFTMDRTSSAKNKRPIRQRVRTALRNVGKVRKVECYGPMQGPRLP